MKTTLIFLLFTLGFVGTVFSNESLFMQISDYYIDTVIDDEQIPKDRAVVRVSVSHSDFEKGEVIQYGYQSLSFETTLNDNKAFEFSLDSGIVEFQFYPKNREGLAEITTYPMHIKGGAITIVVIHFRNQLNINELVKKPVIYFYPQKNETISVELKPKGELTFTYPVYENGWNFTATPTGELSFGDKRYNYLFWEAEMEIARRDWMNEGKIVAREELLVYLESTLEHFHFTSKEKADFITFWAPQMQRHDQTFVRFVFNEQCNQFAELNISPTPDQFIRLYILWCPIDSQSADDYVLQQFPEVEMREGFTVLEWGGVQSNTK